jgi:outer membrane protein OmpA-like peptidoglycan-associated protein
MSKTTRWILLSLPFVCWIAMELAFCVTTGEKVKLEGLVVSRQRDSLTMRMPDSAEVVILLTDFTQVGIPRGLLGRKHMPSSDIVPGLWIKVQGVGNRPGHVLALIVSFSGSDLRIARAIQAGLTPLDTKVQANGQQIEANLHNIQANQTQTQLNQQSIQDNQQRVQKLDERFAELNDYNVKYSTSVYFPVGAASLSPQARNILAQLAKNALTLKGYVIQVKGFTDSTGRAALNQELSMYRAQSVISFLEESGNIPLTHMLTPGAMGESRPASSNETPQGRSENRRVEVKVLISRGLAGG